MRTSITTALLAMLAPVAHRQLSDRPSSDQPVSHMNKEMNLQECNSPTIESLPKYHQETACNRRSQNQFREKLGRHQAYRRIQKTGTTRIPNAKTVHCPATVTSLHNDMSIDGFDGVWLFENTASTPVVVAYVTKEGVEVSAFDANIAPPTKDPRAIIQPGQWRSLFSYQGHVFHVRELMDDGTMGNVLLQHRMGLIPITNKYGPAISCDPNEPDLEPLKDDVRDPEFARTPPVTDRHCNVMDIGFRNEVGCPLHGYYSGLNTANTTTGEASCMEDFKFHLGLNPHSHDFVWDWDSKTKYEGTFVGHNFVFRLAKDPSILIDQVTIQPTLIGDCPNLKQREKIHTGMLLSPLGTLQTIPINNHSNNTTTTPAFSNATSTPPTRRAPPSLSLNFTGVSSNVAHFAMGSL